MEVSNETRSNEENREIKPLENMSERTKKKVAYFYDSKVFIKT